MIDMSKKKLKSIPVISGWKGIALMVMYAIACGSLGASLNQLFPTPGYEVRIPSHGTDCYEFEKGKYLVRCCALGPEELRHVGVASFEMCGNKYR